MMIGHFTETAQRLRGKSSDTIYLLTPSCPSCEGGMRASLIEVQSLCRYAHKHGCDIRLVAIMPGNTLWRPLYELYTDDPSVPMPCYYYRQRWYADSSSLITAVQERIHHENK